MWIRAGVRLLFYLGLTFFVLFGIKGHKTDEELKPFVKAFVPKPDKYVYRLVNLDTFNKPRKFAHKVTNKDFFDGKVVGLAFFGLDTIWIDKKFWKHAHTTERISVLLHEYGHLELGPFLELNWNFSHKHGIMPDKCPASIMHPRVVPKECFYRHFNMYIKEVREF